MTNPSPTPSELRQGIVEHILGIIPPFNILEKLVAAAINGLHVDLVRWGKRNITGWNNVSGVSLTQSFDKLLTPRDALRSVWVAKSFPSAGEA